jgi:hypothetical protein
MPNRFATACATDVAWGEALASYNWRGDYRDGLHARRRLSLSLSASLREGNPGRAVDEITQWGGVPLLRGEAMRRTLASLAVLDRGSGALTGSEGDVYAERIAKVSKVYAMHDPHTWLIYDSRVAWALEALRDRVACGPPPLAFAQPPARTAPPYPGAPLIRNAREARDGFLRGSALVRSAEVLQEVKTVEGWVVELQRLSAVVCVTALENYALQQIEHAGITGPDKYARAGITFTTPVLW